MTRNPLIIGNKEFKYQKEALAYFYRMLMRYQNSQMIHGQDHYLLSSLIEYHPNASQKIGVGIKAFFKARTKKGTSCFWLERNDGTTIDFSFITAVKAKGKSVRDVNKNQSSHAQLLRRMTKCKKQYLMERHIEQTDCIKRMERISRASK